MLTSSEIARRRLAGQHLVEPAFGRAAEVVAYLGAVQAQDYGGARWAVGQRARGLTDAAVEEAFDRGEIIRTHVLRPTWHFVAPADLRWMLALTGPRVHTANAHYCRKLELDEPVFRRSHAALAKALEGGRELTRPELARVLEEAGIDTKDALRLNYLVMRAELDAVICSGPRRGKQFTYALLEERVPPAPALERDEALLELTKRYFACRGPATVHDFAWWSGLTVTDAKRGIQAAGGWLEQHTMEGQAYWLAASAPPPGDAARTAHLLPNYDEFFIGFRDRGAILDRVKVAKMFERQGDALSAHVIVAGGQVVGGWKRTLKAKSVTIELNPLVRLEDSEQRAVAAAAEKYGAFLGLPVETTHASA